MKKILKSTYICLLIAMMSFFVMPISAQTNPMENEIVLKQDSISQRANNFPYNSSTNNLYVDGTWRTIATSSTGFNCNVYINGMVTSNYMDVRMLGSSGNIVWSLTNAVATYSGPGLFYCGSNVYSIQVRCNGNGVAWAYPA